MKKAKKERKKKLKVNVDQKSAILENFQNASMKKRKTQQNMHNKIGRRSGDAKM